MMESPQRCKVVWTRSRASLLKTSIASEKSPELCWFSWLFHHQLGGDSESCGCGLVSDGGGAADTVSVGQCCSKQRHE